MKSLVPFVGVIAVACCVAIVHAVQTDDPNQVNSPQKQASSASAPKSEKPSEQRSGKSTKRELQYPNQDLEEMLARPDRFEYPDTTLQSFVDSLSAKHGLFIAVDAKALDEAGVTTDTRINLSFAHIRPDKMLDFVARTHGLAWAIRDDYVVITTPEGLTQYPEIRVYNCSDLIEKVKKSELNSGGFGGGAPPEAGAYPGAPAAPSPGAPEGSEELVPDVGSLVDVIQSVVLPDTWDVAGGNGSIIEYHGGLLVVNHHFQAHRKIQTLLEMLRKARQDGPGVVRGDL